jgi:hypothetical protein
MATVRNLYLTYGLMTVTNKSLRVTYAYEKFGTQTTHFLLQHDHPKTILQYALYKFLSLDRI